MSPPVVSLLGTANKNDVELGGARSNARGIITKDSLGKRRNGCFETVDRSLTDSR